MILVENSSLLNFSYFTQTNSLWQNFLFIISILYVFLLFYEPSNRSIKKDTNTYSEKYYNLVNSEIFILSIFLIDLLLECIHKLYIKDKSFSKIFFKNIKFLSKIICIIIFIIDASLFYVNYQNNNMFRFGKILRPS